MMKNLLRLLILCVLLMPSLAQATTYFDSDFETTIAADGWTAPNNTLAINLVASNALTGSQALRNVYTDVNGLSGGGNMDHNHTGTRHLFTRFGVKVDSTFTIGSNQFTKLLRWYTDTAHTTFLFELYEPQKEYILTMENVYDTFANVYEFHTGVLPSTTGYDQIEGEVLLNDPGVSNGIVRVWINGILRVEALNKQILGPTTTVHCGFDTGGGICASDARWVRVQNYVQSGVGNIYYDRIATGDTRIGMVGSPPPSDTQAPTVPTNFAITANGSATWTASTDNIGVTNYSVLYCTPDPCTPVTIVSNPTSTSATVSTTGDYAVWANDLAGNHSALSNVVAFTAPTTFKTILGTKNWSGVADGADIGTDFDAGYTGRNALKIVSTRVVPTVLNADSVESYNAVDMTTHNDQWCQVTLGSLTGSVETDMGCFVRIANSPTPTWYVCFAVHGGAASSAIVESNNGVTGSFVTDNTYTWAQGDKLRCEAEGTALRLYRIPSGSSSETLVTSMTDGTITGGKTGIYGFVAATGTLTNGAITDFSMGGFAVTPPTPPTVTSLTTDTTGFNETDTGSPTSFRLQYGDNNCNSCTNVTIQATDIVAGRYNITWPQGTQFACLYARDAVGTENTSPTDYQCNTVTPGVVDHGPATGVRSQLTNTPWFTDASLKGLYFAGHSGIFNTVQDYAENGSTTPINLYPASTTALDAEMASLQSSGVNFIRMFVFDESATGSAAEFAGNTYQRVPYTQMPWKVVSTRSDASSGTAITVGVFDLSQFNQTFFDKTRAAVISALNHGITPSVMLYYGWAKFNRTYGGFSHPFWSANNVNGVSCDTSGNLQCEELHNLLSGGGGQPTALQRAQILAFQDAYIHKMIDTLNDIDGFIWEVSNEDANSTQLAWQDRVADVITAYEALNGRKVHPVWNSGMAGTPDNAGLLTNTHVTLVSLICDGVTNYDTNPPAWASGKPIIYDSDHSGTGGVCGTEVSGWPWKEFTRGYHVASLNLRESAPVQATLITQMAQTISYANRMNLAAMLPVVNTTIIGTGYGLKNDCVEYLSFRPDDGAHVIDLTGICTGQTFSVESLDIVTGTVTAEANVNGNGSRSINPAGSNASVVYLKLLPPPTDVTPPVIFGCTIMGQATGSVLPIGTTSATLQCLTDENATLKYAGSPGVAFASMPSTFTSTGGTTHTVTITPLVNGGSYSEFTRGQNVAGLVNTTDTTMSWTVGQQSDLTPPVLSNAFPTTSFPAGSGGGLIGYHVDENASCKYDTTDTTQPLMANTMTFAGLTCSATVSGLADNTTTTYYGRACDTASPTPNCNTSSIVMTVTIAAAAGDVTKPSDVTNFVMQTISQTQIQATWTAATDTPPGVVAGYNVYVCMVSDCSDAVLDQQLGNTTITLFNKAPSTTYYGCVRARDDSNNESANCSNIGTARTLDPVDTVPPSTMTNLRAPADQIYSRSAVLTWDQGTDDRGSVTTTIELCAGTTVSCTDADFTVIVSKLALNYLVVALNPSTTYTARGKFSDGTNLSVAYSNLAQFTTLASGLPQPRLEVPFPGRSGASRAPAGARLPRP